MALLAQYAPSWVVQFPALRSASGLADLQQTLAGTTRERMLRELAEGLEALAAERPLVLVLEDLHWSDPSTVDALALLARRRDPARLLVLATYRPVHLRVAAHPLKQVVQELAAHGQCVAVPLRELSEPAVAGYVAQRGVAPEARAGVTAVVYRRTAGHPLFMVQLLDYLAQQAVRRAGAPASGPPAQLLDAALPQGLRQLLEVQFERLTAEEQQMLEVGSVAGAEFVVASVAAGLETTPDAIEALCDRAARQGQFLEDRGLAAWPDGTVSGRYGFPHALYQEVFYTRLSAGRRAQLHRHIGAREAAGYGARAGEHAAALAMHFVRGRDAQQAVPYLRQAAEIALRRHAYPEAIGHLTTALELIPTLPDAQERTRHELDAHITLGMALITTKGQGAPEVAQRFARARELCQEGGDALRLFQALFGLFRFYRARIAPQTARELGEQLLALAQGEHDPVFLVGAHYALGCALSYLGEIAQGCTHLAHGIACYDRQQHPAYVTGLGLDLGVGCLSAAAWDLWLLGYPDQFLTRNQEALTLAHELSHPVSLAVALYYAARLHRFRREGRAVRAYAEALMALCAEQGFPQRLAQGALLRSWALAEQGHGAEGLAQMQQEVGAFRIGSAGHLRPHYLALLADAYRTTGQVAEGLRVLDEALTVVQQTGERRNEAELYQLKGGCYAKPSDGTAAAAPRR